MEKYIFKIGDEVYVKAISFDYKTFEQKMIKRKGVIHSFNDSCTYLVYFKDSDEYRVFVESDLTKCN